MSVTTDLGRIIEEIVSDGVVGLPTDTIYGVGGLASSAAATARLFAIKRRSDALALPVLVADSESAEDLLGGDLETFRALSDAFWPGALTIVSHRREGLLLDLGGDPSTIGVRCPAHRATREVIARTGPLAVTSANVSGEPPATSPDVVESIFGASFLVLDGGVCDAPASTVVAITGETPVILREGSVRSASVLEVCARR